MPRKPFQSHAEYPYHLTARSNNRDWFPLPLAKLWPIFSDYLHFINRAYDVRIHAFVLMGNHFHLIASFPSANVSQAMNYFMRETSRVIGYEAERINHVYGARVFRSCIQSNHYFEHAYKYVYRNPIEAGICKRVEEYRYSTLNGLLGFSPLTIPIEEDKILFEDLSLNEKQLMWLNRAPDIETTDHVRKALKRPIFRLPNCPTTRRRSRLESERY